MKPRRRPYDKLAAFGQAAAPETPEAVEAKLAIATEKLLALELQHICDKGAPFDEFCAEIIDFHLTPAQKELYGVLFDRKAPDPKYSEQLFGGLLEVPGDFRTIAVVAGRGSGKSITAAAYAIYVALTHPLIDAQGRRLKKTEAALIPLVAPDMRFSRHDLQFVKGFFSHKPTLANLLKVESTLDVVRITRPDGCIVHIEARPASGGGKAVRGHPLAAVILDEAAFFYGEGYEVNDREIYNSAIPRLLQGAKIVLASTPWAQAGVLYELYRDNFGKPQSALVACAPTMLMQPSEQLAEDIAKERARDPDNAAREFDAKFLSGDAERFFPEAAIERSIDKTIALPAEVLPGTRCRFGADFAFVVDSAALLGFEEKGPVFSCCSLVEQRPMPGSPLVPREVVAEFAKEIQRCGGKMVVADAHYRMAIEEHLSDYGLALAQTPNVPGPVFVLVRSLMNQGRVRIPDHPRLLAQLRRVRATLKPGGIVHIHQTRARDGGHGDLVSAMVCALSGASLATMSKEAPPANRLEAEARAEKTAQVERLAQNGAKSAKQDEMLLRSLRRRWGSKLVAALRR